MFWNRLPLVIPVILKCVTSTPSAGLREMTSPLVDCVSSFVVVPVIDGVSATGTTVMTDAVEVLRSELSPVVEAWTLYVAEP